jgi:hypothetical protein
MPLQWDFLRPPAIRGLLSLVAPTSLRQAGGKAGSEPARKKPACRESAAEAAIKGLPQEHGARKTIDMYHIH